VSADGASIVDLARRLTLHEARVQQGPGRELRDLGDAWLLHDPVDAEPFWNRVVAPMWPSDDASFDRRLDEVITLFATLGRAPHVRPLPAGGSPDDLVSRLLEFGFTNVGSDRRMALGDPAVCEALAMDPARLDGLDVRRHPGRGHALRRIATDAAVVLGEAFGVDPDRRAALEADVMACGERPGCSLVLLSEGSEPVAVARAVTVDDATYLSSIGTRPPWRARGLGGLVTAIAVSDALAEGSSLVHLAVEVHNEVAIALYERLGFELVGEPVADLILLD
jgi:ribosomal protein S18 acetylase RimI-like enzyme